MSDNWQLEGSVLYSFFKSNADASYGFTEGESNVFDNPNVIINACGRGPFDRSWQIKLMSPVIMPGDWILSGYFQHLSGRPWTRIQDRVYLDPELDVQETYIAIRAEEKGSRRDAPFTFFALYIRVRIRTYLFHK